MEYRGNKVLQQAASYQLAAVRDRGGGGGPHRLCHSSVPHICQHTAAVRYNKCWQGSKPATSAAKVCLL
jgi:hypothetical protein